MISIVIPTYKRLSSLQKCLQSVISQMTEEMELVVVDDFSQDGTKEYLQDLAGRYPAMKVSSNPQNQGVNYSRNRGIELVTKKFILFLDNDDELVEGSLQKVQQTLRRFSTTKHFLFLVSDRAGEFKDIQEEKKIYYEEWIGGKVSGDFTHVVLSEVMKKYPFFEEFRLYEHLNWLRIKKETSPQLMIPFVVAERDRDRSDSLTASAKLKNKSVIQSKFEAEKVYYSMYHADLRKHNPKSLTTNLLHTIALGMACNRKGDCETMIRYTDKNWIKVLGRLIMLMPSSLLLYGVTRYSALKG
ncbi:MAG: glycosyltransferase family 2 protein [Williamsia sp.]|nr:glycosyltransferase family 2 protein [Williamsia sp.]